MIIWKDISVIIRRKLSNRRKNLNAKNKRRSFIDTYGEVPVVHFNPITKMFEDVVNPRGKAYAARNRLAYRKG